MIPTIVASLLVAATAGTGVVVLKYCLERNVAPAEEHVEVNIEINEIPAIPIIPQEVNDVRDNEQ